MKFIAKQENDSTNKTSSDPNGLHSMSNIQVLESTPGF